MMISQNQPGGTEGGTLPLAVRRAHRAVGECAIVGSDAGAGR